MGSSAIRRGIARFGLSNVTLLGLRNDIPALMAAADIVALPSAFEGLPLSERDYKLRIADFVPSAFYQYGGREGQLGPWRRWIEKLFPPP